MNTNESDFERELRELRPVAPSPTLGDRIAREMSVQAIATVEAEVQRSPWGRVFSGLGWAVAGAAATIAALAATDSFNQRSVPAPAPAIAETAKSELESVGVTRELIAAEDGGFVSDDTQEPTRLVRYTTLERHTWTDPATGAQLQVEVPREDMILMPVAMQ
jgi:hypothetical protein